MRIEWWALVFLVGFLGGVGQVMAYDPKNVVVTGHELPAEFEGVGVTERLGQQLDLSLEFRDDFGRAVTLGQYFTSGKPVLMAMVYYECPSLCHYHLNGITETLKGLKWTPGQDFEFVAVSMDPREDHEVAGLKKSNYIQEYGRPESHTGWHFLTGQEAQIQRLADQLGFRFKWNEDQKQFAHAAAAYILTPGGQISRYLYGVQPQLQTLRLGLLEASNGKIGSIVDQILLFCFQFNPQKSQYTLYAWNIMRAGAVVMALLLAVFLIPVWLRERRLGSS